MTLTEISRAIARFLGFDPPTDQAAAQVILALIDALLIFGFLMLGVLVLIYVFRKIVGFIQARLGPRYTGPRGILQTLADALKLLRKEDIIPRAADRIAFNLAPLMVFLPAYLVYIVIPFGDPETGLVVRDLNVGVLYLLSISSVTVIGIVTAGWASANKWSLLGGMRSGAQLISYEVPMTLVFAVPVLLAGSLRLSDIVRAQGEFFWQWNAFRLDFFPFTLLAFITFLICALAETNQTPFDLPEAESELVAGFHVEYSGFKFAIFFLAEFGNTIAISAIATHLFLGGWKAPFPFLPDSGFWSLGWFFFKVSLLVLLIIWIRGTLLRVRIDQVMELGWKVLLPIGLICVTGVGLLVSIRPSPTEQAKQKVAVVSECPVSLQKDDGPFRWCRTHGRT
ncbi:MAG: NADH-quinone oxidoreductase subunit NuoH [Armatimonadetes bacterium]|nr:NADH-quinone oxidoreductase subunit NuoH [Armatimonadota bacterium]MDW8121968.1 NADH-quinone oxidoreductase subunit NuoH [Armatimonadota bacterium]